MNFGIGKFNLNTLLAISPSFTHWCWGFHFKHFACIILWRERNATS
jgi:hypothetical protein